MAARDEEFEPEEALERYHDKDPEGLPLRPADRAYLSRRVHPISGRVGMDPRTTASLIIQRSKSDPPSPPRDKYETDFWED